MMTTLEEFSDFFVGNQPHGIIPIFIASKPSHQQWKDATFFFSN